MLELINRYLHGYVSLPIIATLNRHKVFEFLKEDNYSLEQLTKKSKANSGYLQIGLHLLESLQWIRKEQQNEVICYKWISSVANLSIIDHISKKILSLYRVPLDTFLSSHEIIACLKEMTINKNLNSLYNDFLIGTVLTPLLVAIKQQVDSNSFQSIVSSLTPSLKKLISDFFLAQAWVEKQGKVSEFTELGQSVFNRSLNMAMAVSYRPMLAEMDEIIFGDPQKVFARNHQNHELHVERALNVIGSGFQHEKYFADLEEMIVGIFNNKEYAKQPHYIVDMGCGDGSLLKRLYEVIRDKTFRGQELIKHPVTLIGVDFNEAALIETQKTLTSFPHLLLTGDIADPQKLIEDLKSHKIDTETCLHIRSFLDHDRMFKPAKQIKAQKERERLSYSGVYVDKKGEMIPGAAIMQDLVTHLSLWSDIVNSHGMIILEVHNVEPSIKNKFIDQCESFYFDILQAFSHQLLIESSLFLVAAAEGGLFSKPSFTKRYPSILPYTRITANYFEKKDYSIRHAVLDDMPELLNLEKCWPKHLQVSKEILQTRINHYPEGQFVLTVKNKIIGVVYTQRIKHLEALDTANFNDALSLHVPDGDILQLITINIDPKMQDGGFGSQLLQFVLRWATLTNGIEKIAGVTRCLGYKKANKKISLEEYVNQHIDSERGIDPILRFHTSHGAMIKKILPHYRPEDTDNLGAGVLIEYAIRSQVSLQEHISNKTIIDAKKIVKEAVLSLLSEKHRDQYTLTLPLRELGFDSLSLLELRTVLEQRLQTKLDPTFFFRRGTTQDIIQYFSDTTIEPASNNPIHQSKASEPIAIIGMACRFPGEVNNLDDYWKLLAEGRDAISTLSADRKKLHGWEEGVSEYGGFLSNIDSFDPLFFNISPREAELMDPQQRILLQTTWEAIENAGIAADKLTGTKTAVFVGHFTHDYETLLSKSLNKDEIDSYYGTGNSSSVAAGRISYTLGLQGPAIAVNTACSSSLVAVHLACQSLKQGESLIAIAAGVNLILSPELTIAFDKAGMLSPDGKCKTFDASANGYVRSEGCGVVILKRLSDAIKDHDNILAIIKGSAVNQDGASNGLTAPNQQAQIDLMKEALNNADLSSDDIQYFEAHGTGTSLGDPVEVKAIEEVYKNRKYPLYLGSVKTNLGHLEAAAGIASLIKVVLSMQQKQIPPHLHFNELNSLIDFSPIRGCISDKQMAWQDEEQRSAMSSFGSSGTNAHIILESAPIINEKRPSNPPAYLITFSAKTNDSLKQNLINFYNWLENNENNTINEISYTLNVGRCHFANRVACVVDSLSELKQVLKKILNDEQSSATLMQNNEIKNKESFQNILNKIKKSNNKKEYKENMLQVVNLYLNGESLDFNLLYEANLIRKIQLPSYAFAKERYWISSSQIQRQANLMSISLHPMLDANVSTLGDICFSKQFFANEFYLRDHRVDHKSVLPGVAYLEMARIAAALSEPEQQVIGLSQVVWIKPIILENNDSVLSTHIHFYPMNQDLEFEIVSLNNEETVLHAQGKVSLSSSDKHQASSSLLDIESVKQRTTIISAETIYKEFSERGLRYGPSFQAIQTLWRNDRETLSQLQLPTKLALEKFMLHPSLLDAALQTVLALKGTVDKTLYLPFSLGRVDIIKPLTKSMYAYAKATSKKDSFSIQLVDDKGQVAVVLDEFIIRPFNKKTAIEVSKQAAGDSDIVSFQSEMLIAKALPTLQQKTENVLKKLISETIKLPIDRLQSDASFEKYGIDSVLVMQLNQKLESEFGELSKTLFFEYQTLRALAGYFAENHTEKLLKIIGHNEINGNQVIFNEQSIIPSKIHASRRRFAKHAQSTIDIAIVGISGRFPGAKELNEFWENLRSGKDSIIEVPKDRWESDLYHDANKSDGKSYSKWGGFIDDVDKFDPLFFNISPREAEILDPQERIFLETAWHTLEDAGYTRQQLNHSHVGVYVGVMYGQYQLFGSEAFSFYSSIANRVSYYFNFHGPSIALDTMCSSSLTAIHLACENIRKGESDLALAGGVNVSIHPNKYLLLSQGKFLSSDGRCRSFGEGGDGYVPGEGVGAVLLKPLEKAIQDGDHIYAIIKGSTINHGGKTNGYTVPNPVAQASLIENTFKKANIDPATISYVEAHGTGTALGDPIEITALTKIFNQTNRKIKCAIGSVKSNIGHLESAAGMAGLIKVILQMQYGELVPSLHSETINPNINFSLTPFEVVRELRAWDDSDFPRRAGISSFGAGGSNAHIILEEYVSSKIPEEVSQQEQLFVFSAKNEERLKALLLTYKKFVTSTHERICDIAYTLQVGREAMDCRLAIVAKTKEELLETMIAYLEDKPAINNLYVGNSQKGVEALRLLMGDEESKELLLKWIKQGKLAKIAELWVNGIEINWSDIQKGRLNQRVSLPKYPFLKERYWIAPSKPQQINLQKGTLHPMLDANISTLNDVCFSKQFSADEFYLKDHRVNNKFVLPGVAYLEMARVAAALAEPEQEVIGLSQIVWMRPIVLENNASIVSAHIHLYPTVRDLEFEIVSLEKEETIVHAQGKVKLSSSNKMIQPNLLDIESIKQRSTSLSSEAIYKNFAERGLQYGHSFQALKSLWFNEQEALSQLQLPPQQTLENFVLHPSLLDAALQTVMGLKGTADKTLYLPFSIGQIDIMKPLTEKMLVYVKSTAKENIFSIQLIDEHGNVAVVLNEFLIRDVKKHDVFQEKVHYYQSKWEKKTSKPKEIEEGTFWYITDDSSEKIIENLKSKIKGDLKLILLSNKDILIDLINNSALPRYVIFQINRIVGLSESFDLVFSIVQAMLLQKPKHRIDFLFSYDSQTEFKCYAEALSVFWKTLVQENPNIHGKLLALDQDLRINIDRYGDALIETILQEDIDVQYKNGETYVKCYEPTKVELPERSYVSFKSQGTYIITGGAGGLGLIVAEHLAKNYQAKLILIGRSELKAEQIEKINELKKLGSQVFYERGDITNLEDAKRVINNARTYFGVINGIIHSAGVIKDSFIIKKTRSEIAEVLSPKINGTINLDELTKEDHLDFFILFSSVAGVVGNIGQCDYAYANCFMDAFAHEREEQRKQSKRFGRAVSINWPLWEEGGMHVDLETQKWLKTTFGMVPLTTQYGLEALEASLSFDNQLIVLQGDEKLINRCLKVSKSKKTEIEQVDLNLAESSNLFQKICDDLLNIVSDLLKINIDQLEIEQGLSEYGMDSIAFTTLTNKVNEFYRLSLTPAILFEHKTLASFANYLLSHYQAIIKNLYDLKPNQKNSSEKDSDQQPVSLGSYRRVRNLIRPSILKESINNQTSIAVIGMSGIFPGASNIDEFWKLLENQRSGIREIPKDRWDWTLVPGDKKIKWGGFIEGIDEFDASFFNISPHEAELMDPQQRIFLQTVWNTLEDSGYTAKELTAIKTGLFVGVSSKDYSELLQRVNENSPHSSTGTAHSILANRVSYFLNWSGPSEAIDTACSSSLVALHHAIKAIHSGDCEVAIVGGVNALLTPTLYQSFAEAGMLSEEGRCKTFDHSANGYVRGEGVGAILLKPLSKALNDGDFIYGIIKGSAVNHGGHVSSLTVPNPNAQAELLVNAYQRANVSADTISYIETHGTGTSLGDPIEINGLKKAFSELGVKDAKNYCGLGAVKTNIGHLESAAGIAGVIKVLLAMQNKKLPGNLHFEKLNPYIEIIDSPFYVIDKTTEWKHLKDENGKDIPYRAGISSFGFGGANAHIVLEECNVFKKENINSKPYYLLTLSAKNLNALKNRIKDLHKSLINNQSNRSLENISYTLNVGRIHFETRIAFVVKTIDELCETLVAITEGKQPNNCLQNYDNKKAKQEPIFIEIHNKILEELFSLTHDEMGYKNKLISLADLYIKGYELDWNKLHAHESKYRVSLPTYPFEKERHWVPEVKGQSRALSGVSASLHPLIDTNLSTLEKACFSKELKGEEFFLRDHQVQSNYVLPGVAYLEMARAAAELALPEDKTLNLSNIVWIRPITITDKNQSILSRIHLYLLEDHLEFEVVTGENEPVVHAQGSISFNSSLKLLDLINLEAIRSGSERIIEKDEIYQEFYKRGLHYGPCFQVLQKIWCNNEACLSQMHLPKGLTLEQWTLHPCLLDGALQTVIGMSLNGSKALYLPFSIGRIEIKERLEESMFVYVKAKDKERTKETAPVFDIQLLDKQGQTLVSIEDFTVRAIQQEELKEAQTYFYQSHWEQKNNSENELTKHLENNEMWFISDRESNNLLEKMRDNFKGKIDCMLTKDLPHLDLTNKSVPRYIIFLMNRINGIEDSFNYVFHLMKQILQSKPKVKIDWLFSYDLQGEKRYYAEALSGLIKTIAQENPNIRGRIIGVDRTLRQQTGQFCRILFEALAYTDIEICYKNDEKYIKRYLLEKNEVDVGNNHFKQHGVYVITGGLGGLGLIVAEYLAKHYQAKLVLIGRSELTEEQKQKIKDLSSEIVYEKGNIVEREELAQILIRTRERFRKIDGIIHIAGIIRDSLIAKKTEQEIQDVLAPKIQGTLNLDELTQTDALECFILFSSIASILGNIGQSDYAYANGFMDAFARVREEQRAKDKRKGKTISINWPLWKDGGMQVNKEAENWLRHTLGLSLLSKEEGLTALEKAISFHAQCIIMKGEEQKSENAFLYRYLEKNDNTTLSTNENYVDEDDIIFQKVRSQIIKMVGELLKIKSDHLDTEQDLSEYGMDSIVITSFINEINKYYHLALTPAIMFEHPTLSSFAKYLVNEHINQINQKNPSVGLNKNSHYEKKDRLLQVKHYRSDRSNHLVKAKKTSNDDVAIIGMAGIFPGAKNLIEFWDNLISGKNCIRELPAYRWDWTSRIRDEGKENIIKNIGLVEDIDKFDAHFFNISPREAELMDPQQRLFLEVVWNTLEDAGYTASQLAKTKTGLFVGVCTNDYFEMLQMCNEKSAHVSTGVAHSVVANRISFLFNWKGPSIAVDTACSSSLVAVDYALKALLAGDCDTAVAGGVNAILSPTLSMSFSNAGMLSEDGRCKTFDKSANGYVRGEGAGAVLLKTLTKALDDGDQIYGIIKASAVNHGGHVSSLTVPNPNAQAELIIDAYRRANIDPETISYIETHGTGTPLGDPIEINGLKKAFAGLRESEVQLRNKLNYCGLGSVKSNIGHLEGAAGIASLIKVLLAIKHKYLPANLNFELLNPYIELEGSPFYIVSQNQAWEHSQNKNGNVLPRRAGISSFGFGGTNAHIVIEEAFNNDQHSAVIETKQNYLLILSGKTENAVYEKLTDLKAWLEKSKEPAHLLFLENISFTLNMGRAHFDWRIALVVNSVEELKETLSELIQHRQPFNSTPVREITHTINHNPVLKNLSEYLVNDIDHRNDDKEYRQKLLSIASLYVEGYDIDLNILHKGNSKRRISLPTYPFEKKVFYMKKENMTRLNLQQEDGVKPIQKVNNQIVLPSLINQKNAEDGFFLKSDILNEIEKNQNLLFQFKLENLAEDSVLLVTDMTLENICIKEHLVYGEHVLPTDAIVEMTYIAAKILFKEQVLQLENVQLLKPIILYQGDLRKINVLIKKNNNIFTISIFSCLQNEKDLPSYHLKGEITIGKKSQDLHEKMNFDDKDQVPLHDELMNKNGIYVEEFYHSLKSVSLKEDSALASIEQSPKSKKFFDSFLTNVSVVDALVGLGLLFAQKKVPKTSNVFLPIGFERFAFCGSLVDENYFAYLKVLSRSNEKFTLDLELYSVDGIRKAFFRNIEVREVDREKLLIMEKSTETREFGLEKPDKIIQIIKEMISEILYVNADQINEKRSFVELGMDSVLGIEFIKKIETYFVIKINNSILYSSPNVASFAKRLMEEYPHILNQFAHTEEDDKQSDEKPFVNLIIQDTSKAQSSDIAIIGISGRFPDAADVDTYWSNLENGINSIREIPVDRWDMNVFYDPSKDKMNKTCSKVGAFIKDIDLFDPYFFNITPYEAQIMDPKQRVFLEEAWKAIEDAGYNENMLSRVKCGVFVGASAGDYDEILARAGLENTAQAFTGLSNAILASRISYFLNLKGPSLSVDTACSSSLVAIHLARESILSNQCDIAITGGVSLLLTPRGHIMTAKAGMLSSSPLCRPFDKSADGILLGEGVGVLVLKRLDNAIKDNNQIYGIIKASGINQDGTTNGITAPNPDAQYDLILEVCNKAKINPENISYVEAHGTGTPLGDPIEFSALTKAHRKFTSKNQYCALGSVKANIGHTGMAAGVAGVMKVLMSLRNKKIPALINYKEPNDQLDLKNSPFYINTSLIDWSAGIYPRLAAVSSFGFSGTNAHIIIAEGTL